MSIFAAYGAVSPAYYFRGRTRHFSREFSKNEVSTLASRRLSDKIIRRDYVCFYVDTRLPYDTPL